MLKPSGTICTLLALAAAVALAAPASAQQSAAPKESPRAMSAPAGVPQGAPTDSDVQVEAEKATPQQQELARKVALAMYLKDPTALKQLIAPSTLKCIGKNEDYLDDRIRKQFALPISKDYHLTVIKLSANVGTPNKFATYPMPPTHVMGMEFATQDGSTATVNEMIGQEDGKWYEAQPCPTKLGLQRFAKQQQMRAQGLAQAKEALARVQEPLKSQLLALIAKRDNADAWKLCMSSLHVDFTTAHRIVAMLAGDEPD
jgi:hypothetical protein